MFTDDDSVHHALNDKIRDIYYPIVEEIILLLYCLKFLFIEDSPCDQCGCAVKKDFGHEPEEGRYFLLFPRFYFWDNENGCCKEPKVILIGDDFVEEDKVDCHEALAVEKGPFFREIKSKGQNYENNWNISQNISN